MAIARGAGTEIIRSASFEDVDSGDAILIMGEQHHIYTVLSVIIHVNSTNAATDRFYLHLTGYDSNEGTTAQYHRLVNWVMGAGGDTYVFNDKFSFNGFEPTDFAGPMDNLTKQDAIADQGSSVAQHLYATTTSSNDDVDVHITYIDQNNE